MIIINEEETKKTSPVEQSTNRKANSFLAGQDISRSLLKPCVHYHVDKT